MEKIKGTYQQAELDEETKNLLKNLKELTYSDFLYQFFMIISIILFFIPIFCEFSVSAVLAFWILPYTCSKIATSRSIFCHKKLCMSKEFGIYYFWKYRSPWADYYLFNGYCFVSVNLELCQIGININKEMENTQVEYINNNRYKVYRIVQD